MKRIYRALLIAFVALLAACTNVGGGTREQRIEDSSWQGLPPYCCSSQAS